MHQEDEMPDEVTLSKHHYPDHLIETGLVMFSKRPTLIMKTDSGDTKLSFPGTGDGSREFANHLIAVRQQMKWI